MTTKELINTAVKRTGNGVTLVIAFPLYLLCLVERYLRPSREGGYQTCAQMVALIPGLPGVYVRRAFYRLALEACSNDCCIGFGAVINHSRAKIGRRVYIGPYALIGCVDIGDDSLIGSRVSVISGRDSHFMTDSGTWSEFDLKRVPSIRIAPRAWVGEGAIILADIGRSAMVAAGSVISSPVPDHIMVAGNPARFVKKITPPKAAAKEAIVTDEAVPAVLVPLDHAVVP